MSACINELISQYGAKRIVPGYDIVVVPGMVDKLNMSADTVLESLVEEYPIRRGSDKIVPEEVQWVHGSHHALKYRGRELMREKIWLQRGSVKQGYAYYYYTGVQWEVVPAQTDWDDCPQVNCMVKSLDQIYDKVGAMQANQAIVTRYRDGDHNIGKHYVSRCHGTRTMHTC